MGACPMCSDLLGVIASEEKKKLGGGGRERRIGSKVREREQEEILKINKVYV